MAFLDVNGVRVTVDTLEFADLLVSVIERCRDVSELAHVIASAAEELGD